MVINGQKTFISNGILCDLLILAAKDPTEPDPHRAVNLYVVEAGTPGFEKGRKLKKIGWHSQDTAELFFTDCRIPKENLLGEKGSGFLMLMQKLQQERLMVALGAVPAAERILEMTIKYCRERTVFGRPLSKFQNTQFKLVEMATEIKLGRTFLDKLVMDHIEGKNIVVEVSMAKYWTTEMAMRVADGCLQLHGGYGYCEEYPIARAWRDLRVMQIFAGTKRNYERNRREIHGVIGAGLCLPTLFIEIKHVFIVAESGLSLRGVKSAVPWESNLGFCQPHMRTEIASLRSQSHSSAAGTEGSCRMFDNYWTCFGRFDNLMTFESVGGRFD